MSGAARGYCLAKKTQTVRLTTSEFSLVARNLGHFFYSVQWLA